MIELTQLFSVSMLIVAGLAFISITSPKKLWIKLLSIFLAVVFIPVGYIGYSILLSQAKPVSIEWINYRTKTADVIAASLHENVAIYLWLEIEGVIGPRAYALPWNQETAQQLQNAMRDAEENGTGVQMQSPFETDRQPTDQMFYAVPQPARPLKDHNNLDDPVIYSQPDLSTEESIPLSENRGPPKEE